MMFLQTAGRIWSLYIASIVDVLAVAILLYYMIALLRGTRSENIIRGVVVFVAVTFLAKILGLKTLFWIFKNIWVVGAVSLVIIFQPELRFLLARLGKGRVVRFFLKREFLFIDDLIRGLEELKKKKEGALLIFEFNVGLKNYTDKGIPLEARISGELLVALFLPPSPLHDGAVVIRGDKIVAASVILPLSNEPSVVELLGTRHRAAVGITEVSDAVAVVLSQETGVLSLAREGKLMRNISMEDLKNALRKSYQEHIEKRSVIFDAKA